MNPTPRFLILRGGAIGDFVMTLPVLEALRKRWPSCRIEVIGYPHIASLALVSGLADRIRSLDEAQVAQLFVPEHPLRDPLADYIRGFDVIISYLYDPDDSVRTSLEAAGARLVLTGSPRMGTEPAARQLMKPLESLALTPDEDPVPRLCLPEGLRVEGHRLATAAGPNPVLIHPGSGSPNKNWPFDRFLEVARRLRTAGYHPLFSFGEADHREATLYAASHESFPTLPPPGFTCPRGGVFGGPPLCGQRLGDHAHSRRHRRSDDRHFRSFRPSRLGVAGTDRSGDRSARSNA